MLVIGTLNAWGIPIAPQRIKRMQAIAYAIAQSEFDIIGLQEVWQESDRQRILTAARAGGYHAYSFTANAIGSGLMTLSRYPIQDVAFLRYRNSGSPEQVHYGDYIAAKGIGLTRIKMPQGMLDFYNTHLIAQYHEAEADTLAPHRAAQMFEAAHFINTYSKQNSVILVGDLNTRAYQVGYQLLTQYAGLIDVYRDCHPDDKGFTIANDNPYLQNPVQQRIDYIMVRGGLRPKQVDLSFQRIPGTDLPYSDHYGLSAKLEFTSIPVQQETNPQAVLRETYDLIAKHIPVIKKRRERHLRRFHITKWIVPLLLNRKLRGVGLLAFLSSLTSGWMGGWLVKAEERDLQAILQEITFSLNNVIMEEQSD